MTRRAVQAPAERNSGLFDGLEREMWFLDRMHQLGAAGVRDLLSGVTDETTRRERIWDAILSNGLRTVIIGSRNGKAENFEQCFERLFGKMAASDVRRRSS